MDDRQEIETLPPTLSPTFKVSLLDWQNGSEAEAKSFANCVIWLANELSRDFDLSRLEEVIIGSNYEAALASVNRGGGLPPVAPTSNALAQGLAMTVHVVRTDELWSVIVIWAGIARDLVTPGAENHKLALQIFTHELVHVDEQRRFSRTYPGGWRAAKVRDEREREFLEIVRGCQSEYCAQRRSAMVIPEQGLAFIDMLGDTMRDACDQLIEARRTYFADRDLNGLWKIVSKKLCFLFRIMGYALGHADWIATSGGAVSGLREQYEARLVALAAMPLGWMIESCRDAVQPFWNLQEWSEEPIYGDLFEILERVLNSYGMRTRAENGGMYLEVIWGTTREF